MSKAIEINGDKGPIESSKEIIIITELAVVKGTRQVAWEKKLREAIKASKVTSEEAQFFIDMGYDLASSYALAESMNDILDWAAKKVEEDNIKAKKINYDEKPPRNGA